MMAIRRTIVTDTKKNSPATYNMMRFINTLQKPYVIKLVRILNENPKSYSDLKVAFGFQECLPSSKFAFYLRALRKENLISKERSRDTYYLTFKGVCAFRLLESIQTISNLSMDNVEDATSKLIVDLNNNKSWLKPLIKSEIRLAVKELMSN